MVVLILWYKVAVTVAIPKIVNTELLNWGDEP